MTPGGLGDLEQLVLLAVVRLGDHAYAVSVRDDIEFRTGRTVSRGAVYVTLDRLARKRYLRSRLGEPSAERGGKARRLFGIEPRGREVLRASLQGLREMVAGLEDGLDWGGNR